MKLDWERHIGGPPEAPENYTAPIGNTPELAVVELYSYNPDIEPLRWNAYIENRETGGTGPAIPVADAEQGQRILEYVADFVVGKENP